MNILMANWAWYPTGGDWTYINNVKQLYEQNGHKVTPFSVKHKDNIFSEYANYFLENIDYRELNKKKNISNGIKVLRKAIYSKEAQKKIIKLLDDTQINIAQINNIQNYITPSIIPILKQRNIPIIWRVLDYRIVCPNITLVSHNKICESCKNHQYYHCFFKKCKRNSYQASFVASLESYVHNFLNLYKQVDYFLFQNNFSKNKFIELGFKPTQSIIINNPFNANSYIPDYSNNKYVLYFGRIEKIKGIYTLINAMKKNPTIPLIIIGKGEELESVLAYIQLSNIKNVKYEGEKWGNELNPYLKNASFIVVPSEWYEVSPYVVLEAFAYGKPVIVSKMGGLTELVEDNFNGLVFEPQNSDDLADKINYLFTRQNLIKEMGRNSREKLEKEYSYDNYYNRSIAIFNNLTKNM